MASSKREEYRLLKNICLGNNSAVFVAERNNKLYVIKAAMKSACRVTTFGVPEHNILKRIKHPFITQLIASFKTKYHLCYVMEFQEGGDLMYHLRRNPLSEDAIQFYAAEACVAIDHMHLHGIIHRDIKLKNILIAKDGHIKVADFGCAIEVNREGKSNEIAGTITYMAPELTKEEYYSYEVDWWSLGICLYCMLYRKHPLPICDRGMHQSMRVHHIQNTKILYPNTISAPAISLLKGFLNRNPKERLGSTGFEAILSHEFFANVEWIKIYSKEVEPPYIPQLDNSTHLCHFDPRYMSEELSLSQLPHTSVQFTSEFKDFTYVNPDWKDEI